MNITIDQLVAREVCYNVSSLICELAAQDKYFDDLFDICVRADFETAASENGYDEAVKNGYASDAMTFCNDNDIEPQQIEALEHWIFSDWLADKLIAKGEMVTKDFLGMTIWGRTTSGQLIAWMVSSSQFITI